MVAVTPAAQPTFAPLPLPRLSEKPRLGHQLPTAILYPGSTLVISHTTTRLANQQYDFRVRPRCSSKERDAETGLDFFESRYFSSAQGRFTSPDEPFAGWDQRNSQSWNLYSYGLNNPLKFVDPDGHEPCVNGVNPGNGNICTVVSARKTITSTEQSIGAILFGAPFGPLGILVNALVNPPPVGEGANPPTREEFLRDQAGQVVCDGIRAWATWWARPCVEGDGRSRKSRCGKLKLRGDRLWVERLRL